jgi:hypothetical protein
MFRDIAHLNYLGAEKFTKDLISRITTPDRGRINDSYNIMGEK